MMTVRKSKNNTHVALCDKKGEARTTHEMQCAHNMPQFVWGTVMCSQVWKQFMLFIFSFMAPWTKHQSIVTFLEENMALKIGLEPSLVELWRTDMKKNRITLASLLQFAGGLGHYRKTLRQPLQSSGSCCFDREEEPQILASLPYLAFDYLQSLCSEVFCYQMQIAPSRHWVKFQICLRGSWRQSCIQIKTCALRPRYVPIMILSCTLENPPLPRKNIIDKWWWYIRMIKLVQIVKPRLM